MILEAGTVHQTVITFVISWGGKTEVGNESTREKLVWTFSQLIHGRRPRETFEKKVKSGQWYAQGHFRQRHSDETKIPISGHGWWRWIAMVSLRRKKLCKARAPKMNAIVKKRSWGNQIMRMARWRCTWHLYSLHLRICRNDGLERYSLPIYITNRIIENFKGNIRRAMKTMGGGNTWWLQRCVSFGLVHRKRRWHHLEVSTNRQGTERQCIWDTNDNFRGYRILMLIGAYIE